MESIQAMKDYLEEKADELEFFEGMEKTRHLIEIGEAYEKEHPFPQEHRIEENRVKGCVSGVYIVSKFEDGKMKYLGMSEAKTVQGYLAMLLECLNGLTPKDIVEASGAVIQNFLNGSDIKASLSPNRANAFGNVYKLMVEKALENVN